MPQKKNPDSLELWRGKSGRVFGQMAGLMMAVKGLPSTYNKDLQESFESIFDGTKTAADNIQIATGVLSTMTIFLEKMKAALSPDMLATDLADCLVRKGMLFRETHHFSGRVVALAEREGKPMDQLSKQQLQEVDNRFGDDVLDCFNYERSVEYRTAKGWHKQSRCQGADRGYQRLVEIALWPKSEQSCTWMIEAGRIEKCLPNSLSQNAL
jgi:argininosuccinate lyase